MVYSTWRSLSFLRGNSVNPRTRALLLEKNSSCCRVSALSSALSLRSFFSLLFSMCSVSIVFCRSMNRDVRFLTRVRQEFPVYLRTSAMVYTVQSHRHLSFSSRTADRERERDQRIANFLAFDL